jgi:hypothetical protein
MNLTGLNATNTQGNGIDLDTITTTIGPRYSWSRPSRKLVFFGQGLIGDSHGSNSLFPATVGASSSFDAFALQVGGGVALRISPHLALRPSRQTG